MNPMLTGAVRLYVHHITMHDEPDEFGVVEPTFTTDNVPTLFKVYKTSSRNSQQDFGVTNEDRYTIHSVNRKDIKKGDWLGETYEARTYRVESVRTFLKHQTIEVIKDGQ